MKTPGASASEKVDAAKNDESERALAGAASVALPGATIVGGVAVGVIFGPGPALLVLGAGTLVGVIALFWASLRTLGGDAPLAEGLAEASTARALQASSADERKKRVLRALKDLELEHEMGKMDDADFAAMSARYRAEAKAILREIDVQVEPLRERAERLARAHLKKQGLQKGPREAGDAEALEEPVAASAPAPVSRTVCGQCGTSNETDATFCKKCGARVASAEANDARA